MKKGVLILLVLLVLVISPAVFSEQEASHGLGKGEAGSSFYCLVMDMPRPEAGDVRYFITKCGEYTTWKLWPGKEKLFEGKEPHGALLTVYVNKIAFNSLDEKKGMQNGSMIVKENYTSDKKLAAVTVMYKSEKYNPEAGDWAWIKYDPDFNILAEGKVKECIDCHSKAKDNDYILSGSIK
ncbi:MAG: cytochrome P460 family protein [bacterium]